ncbi:hypothetical protein ACRCUN_03880 [Mycobacterium sp. LTG2003]
MTKVVVIGGSGADGDTRRVIADPQAGYFGAVPDEQSLVPGPNAAVFTTGFASRLTESAPAAVR